MSLLKKGVYFSLTITLFYILSPISIISANQTYGESRYSWFNDLLCKEHNLGGVSNVIIRNYEQAKALCPKKEDYSAIKGMYQKLQTFAICSEINLLEQDVGSQCISQKGGLFELYKNPETNEVAIMDLSEGGKIWLDFVVIKKQHHKAIEVCAEKGKRLPTKKEFEAAEERGLREAFYGALSAENLWALDSANDRYAYVFNGSNGKVNNYYGYKGSAFFSPRDGLFLSAICIGDIN